MRLSLVPIGSDDLGLWEALNHEKLPTNDLAEPGRRFFRIEQNGMLVGYGGYETAGAYALLRSIAIAPNAKGRGVGTAVVTALIDEARQEGLCDIWLLTQTAVAFFGKLGFVSSDRADAPAEILATRQATGLCPASATLMRLSR